MAPLDTGALIPSCSAEQIQAERDAVVRHAEQVAELIRSAPNGFPRLQIDNHRGNRVDFDSAIVIRSADAHAWNRLLQESGLWSFMDQTARDRWRDLIHGEGRDSSGRQAEEQMPPFTVEAAEDMAQALHRDRGAMVARGVAEVHRKLSGDYRSNAPQRFGPRMIVKGLASVWGTGKWLHLCSRQTDALDDLNRFLHLVRGLPEPDHRQGAWHVLGRLVREVPGEVEFGYWRIRLFKNGNAHLYFLHDEDVDRLNRVLAYASPGQIPDTHRRQRGVG
jgi:Domain of unknown function (DUF4942)